MTTLKSIALSLVVLLPVAAFAQDEKAGEMGKMGVGLKAGVVLPQVATELGTTWGGELEVSYRFGSLAVVVAGGYTQPQVERVMVNDPRLESPYWGTQTQRELTAGAGVLYRFLPITGSFNAYAAGLVRAYFLETITTGGEADDDFLKNTEQSTKVGGVLEVGGELRLGPGFALVELQAGGSSLPHKITGDVTSFAVSGHVGYRLMF